MKLPGFEQDLDWGKQKYINYLAVRSRLMKILTENSIRFVLIETDSTWFRDPVDLFLNATVIDDADVVVPVKGLTHMGDRLAFSPMLVEPTNASIVLFEEMNKRLGGNDSLYDQDVLNELCSTQYHGIVCRNFEYNEIADGKWWAMNGLWFMSKKGHCSKEKVQRAQNKFFFGVT
ncbi:unnamed protein product [Strongylus vulgaris]|uniref:Nucleotide-diphospho-sugar transferase domain-containing protein n=1 Tax=Strongylus vulgaris TaxID=40348 RepID=A0A3P7J5Q6_STRVU|nr:unnamed protein product [Strongylus vulgaris]